MMLTSVQKQAFSDKMIPYLSQCLYCLEGRDERLRLGGAAPVRVGFPGVDQVWSLSSSEVSRQPLTSDIK